MTIHDSFIEVSRERDAALRRLAEVEQALRSLRALMAAPQSASREALDQWMTVIAAVLDKGEPR